MAQPPQQDIREVLLAEIKAQEPTNWMESNLQHRSILDAVGRKLNTRGNLADAVRPLIGELRSLARRIRALSGKRELARKSL